MSIITSAVQYILDLGASAMLPIILTIFGLILGQGFVKSFRAGLTVGVGFIGINLVIGLISSYAGAAAQAMVDRLNLSLNVLDVGWPVAASITWATPEYCARNLPEASLWRNIRNLSSKKTA